MSLLEKAQTASSSGAGRASNEIRHSLLNGMPKTSFINEREQTNQLLRSSTGSTNLEMREEYWASASCIEFSAVGGCCASAKKLRNARWRRQRSVDRKDLEAFLKVCLCFSRVGCLRCTHSSTSLGFRIRSMNCILQQIYLQQFRSVVMLFVAGMH